MTDRGHIYFHAPCFDGVVSAALIGDWLVSKRGWTAIDLHPVNYREKDGWIESRLERPSAVVDFLFHPRADVWIDHHQTSFGDERPELSNSRIFDDTAKSCAGLIWQALRDRFAYRAQRFEDAVRWADKIDAAEYADVDEALSFSAPALQVNAALARDDDGSLSKLVASELATSPLDQIARMPRVANACREVRERTVEGLKAFEASAKLVRGEIAVFDVSTPPGALLRYAPYKMFPKARYSAGIVRTGDEAKITVMRNPWLQFRPRSIGAICAKYGGGGHERVGSILFSDKESSRASEVLAAVIEELQAA